MRNPNRINEILDELKIYWTNHSNWRLGQVISNLSYEITGENDPFHLDDNLFLESLKERNK